MIKVSEFRAWKVNGFAGLALFLALAAVAAWTFANAVTADDPTWLAGTFGAAVLATVVCFGFFVVQPNDSRVLIFLGGRYVGSVRDDGFWWTNPFTAKPRVSLRVRNFNSERLKVNDATGNPIEIASVIVWRVVDSARALFDVDQYSSFVAVQSETAIRALAQRYPYDTDDDAPSLRGAPDDIAAHLVTELQARLAVAGVEVIEARISHLAYSPEIAQAMLRRQQAQAVIAARQKIVDGAVGMVEMALRRLREHNVIELDEERKAAMVNNLLVALVSEQGTQPIVNTGSLYT